MRYPRPVFEADLRTQAKQTAPRLRRWAPTPMAAAAIAMTLGLAATPVRAEQHSEALEASSVAEVSAHASAAATSSAAPAAAVEMPVQAADPASRNALITFQTQQERVWKLLQTKAPRPKIESEIDQLLDYHALAVATLGGADRYAETCGQQCAEFESLLTRMIRLNYYRMLVKAKGRPIEYVGRVKSGRGGKVKIKTKIHIRDDGPPHRRKVTVVYVLEPNGKGGWRARDIVTEGVSLKKTYRFEFNKIRKNKGNEGGITGIISSLRAKVQELESGGPKK